MDKDQAVLAFGAVAGFLAGLAYADWQWAVEHAQVIAGLVSYPSDSTQAIAHAGAWSLTSQTGAVLLASGVSEIALSRLLSGVLGMCSFLAIASVVMALGRDAVVALGAIAVILVSRITDYGGVYPIALVGTALTHGAIGLSFVGRSRP